MKLLLVDDDDLERGALRDILRAQRACTITEAANGKAAYELLENGLEPDAIFCDVRMPEIDGVAFVTLIRQTQSLRHLKVIITSSTRDRDVIVTLGKLGIAGYLLKPYVFDKTTASLTQLLGNGHVTVSTHAARNLLAKTVLIVDDDEMTRSVLRSIITVDENVEVVEAENGMVALEHFRNGLRPDLAIFDLKMPRLDGHTLLTRVREDPNLRKTPVMIVSGQQDRERIKSLVQLRISGYLLKPFDAGKVRAAVQQALNIAAAAPAAAAGEPA